MKYRGEGRCQVLNESGSHYGTCILEIAPLPLGAGVVFENQVEPTAIPLTLVFAVEAGIREGVATTSFPFRDMRICLIDASWEYHIATKKVAPSFGMTALQDAGMIAVRNAKPVEEVV